MMKHNFVTTEQSKPPRSESLQGATGSSAGATGIKLYNSWGLGGTDKKNSIVAWEKFETQLKPRANFCVARPYLKRYVQQEKEVQMTLFHV